VSAFLGRFGNQTFQLAEANGLFTHRTEDVDGPFSM
jgi:hypothetical protein